MKAIIPENLKKLANACSFPLYAVGGSVRDFLCGMFDDRADWDICAAAEENALVAAAQKCGFTVNAVYRNTGTVKLTDGDGIGYEFTRFRSDRYARGTHAPAEIVFTNDVAVDARRRDFTANAVYYDIARESYCDPLDGITDIKSRTFRTVAPAEQVFGEDGLRLMRLARLSAQTGFDPDDECLCGATAHSALILDIAPERVFSELNLILHSDLRHNLPDAPYRGLSLLRDTGVLAHIMPELAKGDGMPQRADYHDHDVLEHSFRCVRYAPADIRFAALLHDVGKPFCFLRDGNFYLHPAEGARIANEVLLRLRAPKKMAEETALLVKLHMRDFDLRMREGKVRREIVRYAPLLPRLLALRQADYSACKDDLSPAPTVQKWERIAATMREEGAPFSLSDLKVDGQDVRAAGIAPRRTGLVLEELLDYCAEDGRRNDRAHLLSRLQKIAKEELH